MRPRNIWCNNCIVLLRPQKLSYHLMITFTIHSHCIISVVLEDILSNTYILKIIFLIKSEFNPWLFNTQLIKVRLKFLRQLNFTIQIEIFLYNSLQTASQNENTFNGPSKPRATWWFFIHNRSSSIKFNFLIVQQFGAFCKPKWCSLWTISSKFSLYFK